LRTRAECRRGLGRWAGCRGPPVLRLQEVGVATARHIERMPAGADQRALSLLQGLVAMADGADQGGHVLGGGAALEGRVLNSLGVQPQAGGGGAGWLPAWVGAPGWAGTGGACVAVGLVSPPPPPG